LQSLIWMCSQSNSIFQWACTCTCKHVGSRLCCGRMYIQRITLPKAICDRVYPSIYLVKRDNDWYFITSSAERDASSYSYQSSSAFSSRQHYIFCHYVILPMLLRGLARTTCALLIKPHQLLLFQLAEYKVIIPWHISHIALPALRAAAHAALLAHAACTWNGLDAQFTTAISNLILSPAGTDWLMDTRVQCYWKNEW